MANWKSSMPSKYLKASDFETPSLLTIREFTSESIGDESKAVVYFDESDKGLVLNHINGNTIAKICGSDDTEVWKNKKIVLFASETDYKGERVACIRIRAPKANATIPEKPKEEDLPF